MKFKKLELTGFKSFFDKTTFYIEDGLTGIVGPNGCGKSNIVESLRWCMGETSAKSMRGAGMEDVIFSGTSNRPEKNFSEVSLLIENKDKDGPEQYNKLDEIHSIPDTLYYIIIDYINFDIKSSKLTIKLKQNIQTENLIKLVYRLIGSSEYIINPNLKCKLFNSILCNRENIEFIRNNNLSKSLNSKKKLLKNCLNLYNSIEHIHSKVITRYNIIWFFTNIF